MAEITFKLTTHKLNGTTIVEVLYDGNVAAVIYPTDDGFKVISAHVDNLVSHSAGRLFDYTFTLVPRPWRWIVDRSGNPVGVDDNG